MYLKGETASALSGNAGITKVAPPSVERAARMFAYQQLFREPDGHSEGSEVARSP